MTTQGADRHKRNHGRIADVAAGIAAVLMTLHAANAHADDSDASMFSFSGFGTVGMVHSTEDQADFALNRDRPDGAGHSRFWSMDVDSRFGVQLDAYFTPQLAAVLQLVAEQRYDNTYRPNVEWVNLKYMFTPDFSLRVGRTVLPSLMTSDTTKIGYAYPWVRPPLETAYLLPISNIDGADASYRTRIGDVTNTVQANAGRLSSRQPHGGSEATAENYRGITDVVEYGALTAQITYSRARLTVPAFSSLFGAFRQFGAQGNSIADRYDVQHAPVTFTSVGASYDPGDWFVMGEWASTNLHSVLPDSTAWYTSGGYRYGKLTPYVTYSRIRIDSQTSDSGLNVTGLPPPLVGPALGLNAGLNGILRSAPAQYTVSVGCRWDFMKNTDFKLQFDHSNLGTGSPGLLINTQPGFRPSGSFNAFSFALDFIF